MHNEGKILTAGNPASRRDAKYPKLKELFDEEWKSLTASFKTSKFEEVAARLRERQIGESRFRSYRYGQRRPEPSQVDEVAGWFFADNIPERIRFAQKLREAAYPEQASLRAPYLNRDDLRRRTRDLKVGAIDYRPFCNPTDKAITSEAPYGFIDVLFERFLRLSALPGPRLPYEKVDLADAADSLAAAKLDVVIGILAVADRLLDLSFFAVLPLRIGLNAVMRKTPEATFEHKREELKQALTQRSAPGTFAHIVPVILPMEIGGIYVERGLRWSGGKPRTVKKIDAGAYREAVESDYNPDELLVVVADEITCLEVKKNLEENNTPCELVFPLSGSRTHTDGLDLPQYMLACATHIGADSLTNHLKQAMNLYVDADDDALLSEYIELFGVLASLAKNQLRQDEERAVRWARHQLRLGPKDKFPSTCILPDSFRERARERMENLKEYEPRWMHKEQWISAKWSVIEKKKEAEETKKGAANHENKD